MAEGRRPLIAGNWKMNGLRADGIRLARAVADGLRDGGGTFDLAVCPPFTLLADVGAAIRGSAVALGAQDCHAAAKGAHTGDIAAPMLADLGCRYVIVGHSERRQNHGETDAQVRAKAAAALAAGLDIILCVGETEAERDAGRTLAVARGQLTGSLPPGIETRRLVVAYEPVWAIGTGRTASPGDVVAVHAEVRAALGQLVGGGRDVRILYGGSVKPDNAAALMALTDVDGALVGGASLQADDFLAIARSCP